MPNRELTDKLDFLFIKRNREVEEQTKWKAISESGNQKYFLIFTQMIIDGGRTMKNLKKKILILSNLLVCMFICGCNSNANRAQLDIKEANEEFALEENNPYYGSDNTMNFSNEISNYNENDDVAPTTKSYTDMESEKIYYENIDELHQYLKLEYPIYLLDDDVFYALNSYDPINKKVFTTTHAYGRSSEYLIAGDDTYSKAIVLNDTSKLILATTERNSKVLYRFMPVTIVSNYSSPYFVSYDTKEKLSTLNINDGTILKDVTEINGNEILFYDDMDHWDTPERFDSMIHTALDDNVQVWQLSTHGDTPTVDGDYALICDKENATITIGAYNDVEYTECTGQYNNFIFSMGEEVSFDDYIERTKEGYFVLHPEYLESQYVVLEQIVKIDNGDDIINFFLLQIDADNSI